MKIIIAGGGTGGHLFPGIALAEAFTARDSENKVLFVGSGRPFEKSVLSKTAFSYKSIPSEGLKGRGIKNQIKAISKLPYGIIASLGILRRFKADIVISVGGYSAGPVAAAAWLMGIKIVLQEQNILMGITHRILSRFADRIYVSFADTAAQSDPKKVRFTGNPVRREFRNSGAVRTSDKPFTVLIIGGSQGAAAINTAVTDAVICLKEKDNIFFIHQTGEQDEAQVKDRYLKNGIACTVRAFFHDMAQQYRKADLVICRAGATTVAEVTALGKSVIFIPYPYAADNHQVLNALSLTRAGAAEMILQENLSGRILAERIGYYASNRDALEKMSVAAKSLGRSDAADVIVADCYQNYIDFQKLNFTASSVGDIRKV